MRYDISLVVEYAYDHASDHARNLLHLLPLNIPGRQSVVASLLSVRPGPDERRDAADFFGNYATWIAFHRPIESIEISLKAQIMQSAPANPMDLSARLDCMPGDLAALQSIDRQSPHHFVGPSPMVPEDAGIARFAQSLVRADMGALQAVLMIGKRLHDEMTFDPEATDVHTPPAVAFAKRRGVCQDFTHVMIACLRAVGIPAGYTSGFIRTTPPPGQPRLAGSDAMHAWVRAWCGNEMGWVEFDPTNDTMAEDNHIVVAYGRDYSDVSPVRGTLRAVGGHSTKHAVDVLPLD